MRINFDFRDLEAFLAVKETGLFHLAGLLGNPRVMAVHHLMG